MDKDRKRIYIVWDYWTDEDKVYAIYLKGDKMYFLEQKLKEDKNK